MPRILQLSGIVCAATFVACTCLADASTDDRIDLAAAAARGDDDRVEARPIIAGEICERVQTAISAQAIDEVTELDQTMSEFSESLRAMFELDRFEDQLWLDLCASPASLSAAQGQALTHSLSANVAIGGAITIPAPSSAIVLALGGLAVGHERRRRR